MAHWYEIATDQEIRQGEIMLGVPVLSPLVYSGVPAPGSEQTAEVKTRDLIVITPSCDLVAERLKPIVVFCEHFDLQEEITSKRLNFSQVPEIEKGRRSIQYILPASIFPAATMGSRIVDFGAIFSLPRDFVMKHAVAKESGPRLRLLPPFCEHFAQAFARCYMRIGLPISASDYSK